MRLISYIFKILFLLFILIGSACLATASTVDIRLDVKEFRLENGMLFLVVERPATPVWDQFFQLCGVRRK